jgi:hypothetical protein
MYHQREFICGLHRVDERMVGTVLVFVLNLGRYSVVCHTIGVILLNCYFHYRRGFGTSDLIWLSLGSCSLEVNVVDIKRRSEELVISVSVLMKEAVSSSETPVNMYRSVWGNIPEDSKLHTHRHEDPRYLQNLIFLPVQQNSLWNQFVLLFTLYVFVVFSTI